MRDAPQGFVNRIAISRQRQQGYRANSMACVLTVNIRQQAVNPGRNWTSGGSPDMFAPEFRQDP